MVRQPSKAALNTGPAPPFLLTLPASSDEFLSVHENVMLDGSATDEQLSVVLTLIRSFVPAMYGTVIVVLVGPTGDRQTA